MHALAEQLAEVRRLEEALREKLKLASGHSQQKTTGKRPKPAVGSNEVCLLDSARMGGGGGILTFTHAQSLAL